MAKGKTAAEYSKRRPTSTNKKKFRGIRCHEVWKREGRERPPKEKVKKSKSTTCFFCNSSVLEYKGRCYNMFETLVDPIKRWASDFIADILDITITKDEVRSDLICPECAKMVQEFAELESRAARVRTKMLVTYNNSLEEEEKIETEESKDEIETEESKDKDEIEEEDQAVVDADNLVEDVQGTVSADKVNEIDAQSGD